MGRVDGGITEPQAAVGAKDTNRMTEIPLLSWSRHVRTGGRDYGKVMYRHVTEDPVAREPQRGPQPELEQGLPEVGRDL